MQSKNWGILSLLIIAASIFYYLVIFLPEKEKAKQNQQILAKEDLNKCLSETKTRFGNIFNEIENTNNFKIVLDQFDKQKEDCFKQYNK